MRGYPKLDNLLLNKNITKYNFALPSNTPITNRQSGGGDAFYAVIGLTCICPPIAFKTFIIVAN